MKYINDKGKEVASNYYEGILQLRNISEEVIKAVNEMLQKNKKVFIAKEEKVKNGYDLYLSSQKFIQHAAKELQRKFGGEVKVSKKLYGLDKQTSKKIYRITVLFRLSDFKVGDTVKIPGRFIKITRLGKKVHGVDVDSGKKISVDYDKIIKTR